MVHSPFIRVLVVEDHKAVRRFICSLLEQRAEFRVIGEASDGLEAVRQAQELQPDLILIDIGLPKLNGIQAARQMRSVAPQAKLLFVSLESSSDVVREALRTGAQGYVDKQRVQSELLPAIEDILDGKRYVSRELMVSERIYTRHEVQFYSDDAAFLDTVAPFIAAALRAGDPAIVAATKSHRESLCQRLRNLPIDIDDAAQRGTYIAVDNVEAVSRIMVNGEPDCAGFFKGLGNLVDSALRAAKTESPRVAIFGECGPHLFEQGNLEGTLRLETGATEFVNARDVDILCAYSLGVVHAKPDDRAFSRICAEHTAVYSL